MKKNKRLIVLGSEGALGQEVIREALSTSELPIVAVDRVSRPKVEHERVVYFSVDFQNHSEINELATELIAQDAGESILVSTVGTFGHNYSEEQLSFGDIAQTIQVNLLGITQLAYELCYHCVKENKRLRIIVVGSAAAFVGSRDIGYGIAKAGLNGLVLSLSKCFAQNNITVIGVSPGIFESPMSTAVAVNRQASAVGQTHLKRPGAISEIVNTILYAGLQAPDFMTGSLININGGQYS